MSKEFRIGLIALVAGVLLYYGFNYLKGTDVLSKTNRFYVVYDHINGLAPGSAVNIKGVQIGRVNALNFNQQKQTIVVALDIEGDIQLGDSTVAELTSAGFLGGEIIILKEKMLSGRFQPGDTLIPKFDRGLAALLDKAEPITDNIQITIRKMNGVLTDMEGLGDTLKNSFGEMNKLISSVTKTLDGNKKQIDSSFVAINRLTNKLNEDLEPLKPMLENMAALSDSLNNSDFKSTISSTNALLKNLSSTLDTLKSEKGTLGRLMSDDSLYNNLNKTMVDLDKLLIHFNNYPKDFMGPLGKKNKNLKGIKQD